MHYNQRMQIQTHKCWFLLMLTMLSTPVFATGAEPADSSKTDQGLRVLSWNVGEDAFVDRMSEFYKLIDYIQPDILLLDEVKPTSNETLLRDALADPDNKLEMIWHIDFGGSGGRQVGVIVSRYPLEKVPEFSGKLVYPEKDYDYIVHQMTEHERNYQNWTLNDGIAANAAIVLAGERRVLVVAFDMQCCGNDPGSWQEHRRRVEAREIRKLIGTVLQRTTVDGIIVAGDFNVVSTPMPLVTLSSLNDPVHSNLTVAEVYQSDGGSWTWDGRGTQYPSRVMDFQLYSTRTLLMKSGFVFNSELLSVDEFEQLEFEASTSRQLSDHLPLVIDYLWH